MHNLPSYIELIRIIKEDELGTVHHALNKDTRADVLVKVYPLDKHQRFVKFMIENNYHFQEIDLYQDEKNLYALVQDKLALHKLKDLEAMSLKDWQNLKTQEYSYIKKMMKQVKKNDDQKRQKLNSNSNKIFIFIGLIFAIGIIFAFLHTFISSYLRPMAEITVPDVLNKTLTEAELELKKIGLEPVISAYIPDRTVPKDTVLEMEPEAGRVVKKGRQIRLKLSSGRDDVQVPNFIGRGMDQIASIINKMHIRVEKKQSLDQYSYKVSLGKIVAQDPMYGEEIPEGGVVYVGLSIGSPVSMTASRIDEIDDICFVRLSAVLPIDWDEVNLKIFSISQEGRNLPIEKLILPGSTEKFELNIPCNSVLEAYYNNDIAFKQNLLELVPRLVIKPEEDDELEATEMENEKIEQAAEENIVNDKNPAENQELE